MIDKNENMKILFHGTTYENYKSILINGFQPRIDSAWVCSNPTYMFFYDLSRKTKKECLKGCISNTMFTAIFNNFQGTEFVILELEVPERLCIDDPTVDKEWNDYDQKSTAVKTKDLNISMIKQVYINHNAYNKYLRWWYYANNYENGNSQPINNELFNAIITITETINYENKGKFLNKTMYNLKKYIPIYDKQ